MDRYEKLRKILHKHPTGAPKSKSFDEIMRLLFTPEEVEVACGMLFVPRSIPEIAQAVGLNEDKVLERCESMANKGIVFGRKKEGQMEYALLPTIPGIFELPFMTGGGTPLHDRLGKLWMEYHHEAMGKEFGASKTPLARVIPIEKTLDACVEVLPYEAVSTMLDRAKNFGLSQCACRVSVAGCDNPREVCLTFDRFAQFLVERKLAREITRKEAEDTLQLAEEVGLVHTTNNSQDRLNFLCNCCTCCCTILRGLVQLKNPNAFARSRWHAEVDGDVCVGCGTCEDDRCPIGAVQVVESVAQVDPVLCIGCGLCATTCDAEAISMVPREQAPEPPATVSELGVRVATEKGRLDDFLKLVKH